MVILALSEAEGEGPASVFASIFASVFLSVIPAGNLLQAPR
jgi:hypothetical protein